jgi:hypothetical protein
MKNSIVNSSNQWWELSLAFPIIGHYLSWKVSSSTQVWIGKDAIIGCGKHVFLPKDLVEVIQDLGIRTLNQINDNRTTSI